MKNLNEIEANEITERDNLAVVYRVEALEPIAGKDRVELVRLKDCGYTTICEKGHAVGDLVVFIKYDTVVPKCELFDFLAESKYRIKPKSFTEKTEDGEVIKRIYSQGVVLSLENVIHPYFLNQHHENNIDLPWEFSWEIEGQDLTKELGVVKYIPPVQNSGSSFGQMQQKGDFPVHLVSKTDETNLASKTKVLELVKGKRVTITQKIEGSSCTVLWDKENDELMVCSRNNQIGEHETNKFWQAVNKYNMKEVLGNPTKKNENVIFQGEVYGVGIEKNKLGLTDVDFTLYNVYVDGKLFNWESLKLVSACTKVPTVPLVMVIEDFDWTFEQLQELADAQYYPNGERAEGIVIRCDEPVEYRGQLINWSYKVINREYKK